MGPYFLRTFVKFDYKKKAKPGSKVVPWKVVPQLTVSTAVRKDYADYDYVQLLNKEDLDYLFRFNREYYNADFKHKGKKLIKGTARKAVYDANNQRNRDVYAVTKAMDILDPVGLDIDPPKDIEKALYDAKLRFKKGK